MTGVQTCALPISRRGLGVAWAIVALVLAMSGSGRAEQLDAIRARGFLACGIPPESAPGFSAREPSGRASGFDVDFCRAVAATIFGDGNKIRVYPVETERDFLQNDDIDVAFHGPSWNFSRELSSGLAFGPVIFHDGQAFLARRASGFQSLEGAGKASICVQGNTRFASNLLAYVRDTGAEASVREMPGRLSARAAFLGGQCDLLTDDASALVTMTAGQGDAFEILPDRISKEPMAPAVRRADESLLAIVRWTIYAVIEAEEIGITAATINEPVPGRRAIADLFDLPAASALGLSNDWAYRTIKAVGNYGEIYDRNLAGPAMPRMQRGLNENWTRGGLMYAPPLR